MAQKFIAVHALDGYNVDGYDGYSPIFSLWHLEGFSCQAVFTGTPAGTIKLQVSNDPNDPTGKKWNDLDLAPTLGNWTDVANSAQSVSAAGTFFWDYPQCNAAWVRCVFLHTGSSTAALTVNFVGKSWS